jgi:hypothetical protein
VKHQNNVQNVPVLLGQHSFMTYLKKLVLISGCALTYYISFYLNTLFFEHLEYSFGVNWVFIPSGMRFVLVLIAIEDAAIGIAIASWLIGFELYQLESMFRTTITALISGGSPLLARKICIDLMGIDKELIHINPKSIFLMSVVFAILSATIHQIWFFYNGATFNFIPSLLVMALGDFLGTALVLTIIGLLTKIVQGKRVKKI